MTKSNAKTLSIQEVADRIEISPRTIRKVLRANIAKDAQPGRGARWSIRESDIAKLQAMIESHVAKSESVVEFDA